MLILRRIPIAALLLAVVTFVIFVFMDLVPGDPAVRLAGDNATVQQVEELRAELKLDQPFVLRYLDWLGGVLHGDLGRSLVPPHQSVVDVVLSHLPPTISLVAVAAIIAITVGLAAGLLAAVRPDGWTDRALTALAALGIAAPSFWVGLLLVIVFGLQLQLLPTFGYGELGQGVGVWLSYLVLPAFALALEPAAELARQLRAALRSALASDFVLAARAKGLSGARVVGKHALKNSGIPAVTVFGFRFAQMLGGTVVIEQVFSINGLGSLAVSSVTSGDIQVLLGIVVFTTTVVLAVNMLVDASYSYFNPKLRVA